MDKFSVPFSCDPDTFPIGPNFHDDRRRLTFRSREDNYAWEETFDANGFTKTRVDTHGFSFAQTCDANGNELTYQDSHGFKRGFPPEKEMSQGESNKHQMEVLQKQIEDLIEAAQKRLITPDEAVLLRFATGTQRRK